MDDLPSRLAFQQLNTLSGITAKMQQAINHNKRAFQQRVAETYKLTLRHAFQAWVEARQNKVVREQRVIQARNRIERSLSRRVLLAWRYVSGLTDPTIKMKNKVRYFGGVIIIIIIIATPDSSARTHPLSLSLSLLLTEVIHVVAVAVVLV